jgi:polyhydroxybutyrate depolymerase
MLLATRSNLTWLTLLLAAILAGCGSGGGSDSGSPVLLEEPSSAPEVTTLDETPTELRDGWVRVDGIIRTYVYYLPSSPSHDVQVPLVLAFHGAGGSGKTFADRTKLTAQAERDGFIAVFPGAAFYQNGAVNNRRWNDGRTPDDGIDDVKFVRTLVSELSKQLASGPGLKIDPNRAFATGFSNGGIFSLRLACEAADLIAATAPVAASMPADFVSRCQPARSMPMFMINSDEDLFVPFWGGALMEGQGGGIEYGGGFVLSVFDTVAFWREVNDCSINSVDDMLPEIDPDDGTRVRRIHYPCLGSSEIMLYVVEGGGHTWPGSDLEPTNPYAGLTSQEINASEEIWQFFKAHRLP